MSTTQTIVQYLWDSPLLLEYFNEHAVKQGKPEPTFGEIVSTLTAALSRNNIVWFIADEDEFNLVEHSREDWDQLILLMNQSIADKIAKRLLDGLDG
jgi:hypothetical protein